MFLIILNHLIGAVFRIAGNIPDAALRSIIITLILPVETEL